MGVANGCTLDKASIMMKTPMKIVDFFNFFFPFFFLFGKLIKRFIEMIGLLFSGPPMAQIAAEIFLLMTGRKSTNPYKAAAALKPFYHASGEASRSQGFKYDSSNSHELFCCRRSNK